MSERRPEKGSAVFIGDSITDAGRTYPTISEYGFGFAALCADEIKRRKPGVLVYNRGVAGECVGQIYARWQRDCLALAPALVTALFGANDVDYSYRRPGHVFDEDLLAAQLEDMYASVRRAGAKLIVIEPYAFDGELYKDAFYPRFKWLRDTTCRLAARYADCYMPSGMTRQLTGDGLHPTDEGHLLLFANWMKAAESVGFFADESGR